MFDKICAFVDAQCFVKDGEYYIKELSALSDKEIYSFVLNPNIDYSTMNVKDRKTNRYISNNILGMPLRGSMSHKHSDDSLQELLKMYSKFKTNDKIYFAINSAQLKSLLDLVDIPYIDLSNYHCPGYAKLEKFYKHCVCHFHQRHVPDRRKLRCSLKKCNLLRRWTIDYMKMYY